MKYESVKLKAVDLQAYLEDYFKGKIVMDPKNYDRKEVRQRRIILYLFAEFTTLSHTRIGERFKIAAHNVASAVQDKEILKDHDLKFIIRDLRGELPVNNYDVEN